MPAPRRKKIATKKPASRVRTRSRVELAEGDSRKPDRNPISGKSTTHRSAEPTIEGMARLLDTGEVLISSQLSEVVPVGRFAGITIGPCQVAGKLGGIDFNVLADIDWDSDEDFTPEQLDAYNRIRNALRSSGKIIQDVIDNDREVVDEAVRRFNAQEIAEEDDSKKKR